MCFIHYDLGVQFLVSAVKRLILINHIQNKGFVYIIYVCVLCVCLLFIYKYTHIQYIFWNIYTYLIVYIYI